MKVWRVETKKDRFGPYVENPPVIKSTYSDRTPTPHFDGMDSATFPINYRYGFVSVRKMKEWFTEKDRKILAKNGYVCRIYSVPKKHVVKGKKQLVFAIYEAKLVRKSRTIRA